ncbi:MAG: hypothetical protein KAQ66_00775, partial [Rhodospirillaceae bacterium]|nr:hypothetical protein [Rhodospirillaceae bacterium]
MNRTIDTNIWPDSRNQAPARIRRQVFQVLTATLLSLVLLLALSVWAPASAASRIKDISEFEGVRDNML